MGPRRLKRTMDLAGALLGLVLFSPIMLTIAAAVRLTMGQPVLCKQVRPGLHGKPFVLYKFRTMKEASRPDGQPLPDGERLTVLGRFLRRTSLDELPELFNVLRGEMSLVGPRPLLLEYLDLYTPDQARRHEVKPGITGWAQVNGRNAISWTEKFELDLWYVEHQSIALDLRILVLTLVRVLIPQGVVKPGHATTDRFTG